MSSDYQLPDLCRRTCILLLSFIFTKRLISQTRGAPPSCLLPKVYLRLVRRSRMTLGPSFPTDRRRRLRAVGLTGRPSVSESFLEWMEIFLTVSRYGGPRDNDDIEKVKGQRLRSACDGRGNLVNSIVLERLKEFQSKLTRTLPTVGPRIGQFFKVMDQR